MKSKKTILIAGIFVTLLIVSGTVFAYGYQNHMNYKVSNYGFYPMHSAGNYMNYNSASMHSGMYGYHRSHHFQ